ncbi:hypothetical protein C8F01DRAFT_1103674 [Mycena amicta]|nr:hypothetical protein C8F01DRAFT_1103674 [Mycena amicta]
MPQDLFIDSIFGTSLQIYIDKSVTDREELVTLVKTHGGTVVSSYSAVPYILVDPRKRSGQNLFHQYSHKKAKIVLDARWIRECVKAAQLQTFAHNWAGCKVDGTEPFVFYLLKSRLDASGHRQIQDSSPQQPPTIHAPHPQHFSFQVYVPPAPQQWQPPPPTNNYGQEPTWNHYSQPPTAPSSSYDYSEANSRFRQEDSSWPAENSYYDSGFVQPYQSSYIDEEDSTPEAGPSTLPMEASDKGRGRKSARPTPTSAPPASSLIANRRLPARSPSPPTRVVKSTYGGNLFTADDVIYLKKYITYCHEQGMVLSLREICERVAVKAPHHTFYSWRRYCNKHQIRLGGYKMNADPPDADDGEQEETSVVEPTPTIRPPGGSISTLTPADLSSPSRNRSPTPPRALFRSTTGKGVAFTDEDVTFLVRFMAYRRSQGKLDMVAFWKDVARKAPHHSRASWMKFWRRHKHELERGPADAPVPPPPEKKMRYSRSDDIILAKYFMNKVDGTSDKIFQAFARIHTSHPWKGWQEHFRKHKKQIEHLQERLGRGESLSDEE